MKKRILLVTALAIIVGVFVAIAQAFTQSGSVVLPSGGGLGGARVTIHDNITGANGSTFANSGGTYTFGGLDSSHWYYFDATGCWLHQNYASASNAYHPGGGTPPLPTIHMTALGTAC